MLLVDSGSSINACPRDYAKEFPLRPGGNLWARTASGERLKSEGRRLVKYRLRDGSVLSVLFEVLPVAKPVLSVSFMADRGTVCQMGPSGAALRRPAKLNVSRRTLWLVHALALPRRMKYVISALVQSDGVHLRRLQWSEVAVKKCSLSDDASRAHCMAAPR